jgi:Big-like domain-containing protein
VDYLGSAIMLKKRPEDYSNLNASLFNEDSTSSPIYDITRSIEFSIPGKPPLTIKAIEQIDGSILFTIDATSGHSADIRGLYFNIAEPSLLGSLSITGGDISNQQLGGAADFKNGNNINGKGSDAYDIGLDIGTPGQGQDDISFTSFTLSSTDGSTLTLDLIAHMEFAARTTNSQKTTVIAPAAPDAIDDYDSSLEDTPVVINAVANDTDADGDNLTIVQLGQAENGIVQIVDNQIRYTPNEHWSGTDRFTYTIYDGDGGYDTATTEVFIEAVADAPNLALDIQAGDTVNDIVINITSSLVDTDGSESYILTFDNIPANATLTGDNIVYIDGHYQIGNPLGIETVILSLSEGIDFDFDLDINAISTEASNGDTATTTVTQDIILENNDITETVWFKAENQSIWTTGPEYVSTSTTFLGYDNDFGAAGKVDLGLVYLEGSYYFDLKAGFNSTYTLEGGDIDAEIPWQLDFETNFNKATDFLAIQTDATLVAGGSFNTDGPSLEYMLDFIFDYYVHVDAKLTADLGVDDLDEELINFTWDYGDPTTFNIIDYDSDTSGELVLKFPRDTTGINDYGVSATLAWPNLEVAGSENVFSPNGTYLGDGASNNFFTIGLDVDQFVADIYDVENPLDVKFGYADGQHTSFIGAHLELLDIDLSAGLNFVQEFLLKAGALESTLVFEDGETTMDFTFGDELLFANASTLDTDGDGNVEFTVQVNLVETVLTNDTDIGFNLGYNLDILKGSGYVDLEIIDTGDITIGPLVGFGGAVEVASVDVFDANVGVFFEQQSVDLFS